MVYTKNYSGGPINLKEILRYMGAKERTAELDKMIADCITECKEQLTYKVCYTEADFTDICDFSNCEKCIAFAATTGIGIDRLIAKYSAVSPAKALVFQAIGAERIEWLCDEFENDIKSEHKGLFPMRRKSPGYGAFPLEAQRRIFSSLDCERKIGLTLNNSLVMSPSKSVTAVIGFTKEDRRCAPQCAECGKKDCVYRK